ncbi:MAG: T9SS type A sorting domain-containing protein [Chitinophagales bacterium]
MTVTRPTAGCYAYGLDLGTHSGTESDGFTFSNSFALPHAAANRFVYVSGEGTNVLVLKTSTTRQTMAACAPRSAINIDAQLTITTPVGVNWVRYGNYVFFSTKSASSFSVTVDLKNSASGNFVNVDANNLCTTAWHSWSNLFWGWFTLTAPSVSIAASAATICNGASATLTPTITQGTSNGIGTTYGSTYTYAWTGTPISSATASNPTVTSTTANTYNYTLVVTDGYSCPSAASGSTSVTVKAALNANPASYTLASCALGTATTPPPYADISGPVAGAGVTGTWTVTGGSGTVTAVNSNTTQVTGLSTSGTNTTLTWKLDYNVAPACTNTSSVLTITPPNLTTNLTAVSLENTAAASSPHTRSNCKTCTVKDGNTYTYYDATGKIMMKIVDKNPPTPAELGSTEICVGYDYTPPTPATVSDVKTVTENYYGTQQPYLPRVWTIKPAANTDATVTLYFTTAELTALQNKANSTLFQFSSYNSLAVTKYPGGGTNSYTAPASLSGEVVSATFSSYNSDHQVTFDVNSFSTFYIHPTIFPNAPLPVELVSFTGENAGSKNILTWLTASEQNTEKFEIEKSLGNGWTTIGTQMAAGNSTDLLTYNYTDFNPVVGSNYYRLKIIDFDGTFKYSSVINIPINTPVKNGFISIYPNPTTAEFSVDIQSIVNEDVQLQIIDILGRIISATDATLRKGITTIPLSLNTTHNGLYLVQYTDYDGNIHTEKLLKQ